MKSGMKDQTAGAFHQAKGKAKEVIGQIAGNPKVEAEGNREKVAGKIQKKVGQVKVVLGK